MTAPPCKLLLLSLEGLPGPWPHPWGMPFLSGLAGRAAWGAWEGTEPPPDPWPGLLAGQPAPQPGGAELLWRELARAGVRAGLFNLPGPWPAQAPPGWGVGRMDAPAPPGESIWPPDMAWDLGDYLAGQRALLGRPAPLPHQRDEAFALWACLARLVYEHAHRLLSHEPPVLAGVGFQGLAEVAGLFEDDHGRVELMLAQVDSYVAQLAQRLAPRAMVCLAGRAGFLAWAPGLVPPGHYPEARPWDLTALVLGLLDVDTPPDLTGAWPPQPGESPPHA